MSFFNCSGARVRAPVARERLQILLSHERAARGQTDLLGLLRGEILAAIAKHVTVEQRQRPGANGSRRQRFDARDRRRESRNSAGMLLAAGS